MLTHLCLTSLNGALAKQYRPRSDATAVSDQDLHSLH